MPLTQSLVTLLFLCLTSDVTGLVGYKFDLCNQPMAHLKLRTGSTR